MIEFVSGLPAGAQRAVAGLERRVTAADGGRLKLEWDVLRSRRGDEVHELLYHGADGALTGFVGLYAFAPPTVELVGMVDPVHRRTGVGSALLAAARAVCRDRGLTKTLLVCPRTTVAGQRFAVAHGGEFEHAEYALVLPGPPAAGRPDPGVTLRPATADDSPYLRQLLRAAFGYDPSPVGTPLDGTVVAERDGRRAGTARVRRDGTSASVYGFVVEPAWQHRGIGRDLLRRICVQERAAGVREVRLEVAVGNERALGLYTSLGFRPDTTEDYFALPALAGLSVGDARVLS